MFKKWKQKKWPIATIASILIASMGMLVNYGVLPLLVSGEKVVDIIQISDLHDTLTGFKGEPIASVLSANIREIEKSNPKRTLILGGGDFYDNSNMDTAIFSEVPITHILNVMGLDVTALGNHEFSDLGINDLNSVTMKDADFQVICANLYFKSTNKRVYEPYKIFNMDGIKIAVIGSSNYKINDRFIKNNDETIYKYTDHVEEINLLAKEIRENKKAEVVLALIHEGGSISDSGEEMGELFKVAEQLEGVDALLGGDTHNILNVTVEDMPVVIPGAEGNGFIHMRMTRDKNKKFSFSSEYIPIDTDAANGYQCDQPVTDPEVDAILQEVQAKIKEKLGP